MTSDAIQTAAKSAAMTQASSTTAEQLGLINRVRHTVLAAVETIEQVCRAIVDEDHDHQPQDFMATIRLIQSLCSPARQICEERLSLEAMQNSGEPFELALRTILHDLGNKLTPIKGLVDDLLESEPQRFDRDRPALLEIQRSCSAIATARERELTKFFSPSAENAEGGLDADFTAAEDDRSPRPVGRILVVDDEAPNRDRLVTMLTRQGHAVVAVEDGLEALEQLNSSEFDLVVLDVRMQNLDGCGVLREMKSDWDLRNVPVLMVSAMDDVDSVARLIGMGADDYLIKPFNSRLLQARIRSCLTRRRHQQELEQLMTRLDAEKKRADDLLNDILPFSVAQGLRASGTIPPQRFENVAVLFCDIVGFTSFCDHQEPDEIVALLERLFASYEAIIKRHGVEKIKTIGDCFMATAGLLTRVENPVLACVESGAEMLEAVKLCSPSWNVRVGIHVGPVVAGLAGTKQYAFDMWGDTVNTASRVESVAEPGSVCTSAAAWARVAHRCKGRSLGLKEIHGKAPIEVIRFDRFK